MLSRLLENQPRKAAEIVGTSRTTVERARTVISDPKEKEEEETVIT